MRGRADFHAWWRTVTVQTGLDYCGLFRFKNEQEIEMFDSVKAGRQIARLRRNKGLTQEDVARRLSISPQAVSKWENGHTMPELSLLVELSEVLDSTIDGILFPDRPSAADANFEHILLPYAPIADFTGKNWPYSMAIPAILAAIRLFMGLEKRRDSMGRQINDDTEYILQSAFSGICFGYSWEPERALEDCLTVYGLTGEVHSSEDYSEEEFVHLAANHILSGYPLVILPKEYTDIILATGFSDRGKILKGIPFLDGDDEKNSAMSFQQLKSFPVWYVKSSEMLLIRPGSKTVSVAEKCKETLHTGVSLLSNTAAVSEQPLVGYGLVIYDNWCNELRKENNGNLVTIACLVPHIFIHYEGKLRIKQFLERSMRLLEELDHASVMVAISKYEEMISMCEKCMNQLLTQTPQSAEEARTKRQMLIGVLQRSRELEEEALREIAAAISGESQGS